MALTKTQVSELYTAIFNRASEGDGNAYWAGLNASAATIAQGMLDTTDAATYFGTSLATNQAFVEHIYLNTLNKTVAQDATGIAYWVDLLDAGHTRGEVVSGLVSAVADYATSTDATTLAAYNQFTNRVAVSDYTADTLATAPSDYATSTSFSSGLTVTDAIGTVTTAKAAIDVVKVDNTAVALALTTGVDTLTGSKASDTFTADILTLGADTITDASTTDSDTLNVTTNSAITNGTTLTNIENINITALGTTTVDMTNISGVKSFTTTGSTGAITVNNADSATMALGFSGATNNTVTVNYDAGTLSGYSDNLVMNVASAKNVIVNVDAGYETTELAITGTGNTIGTAATAGVTAPGTSITISGTGDATFAADSLVSSSSISVTNTAALKFGAISTTDVATFTATANTGGITGSTALVGTNIYSTDDIDGATTGLTMMLGSGADNVKVTEAAAATKTNTIKLGAGNDILDLTNAGAGATYVFGEAGDDNMKVSGVALETTDLVSGGAGTDTLVLTGNLVHNLVLLGVENIELDGTTGNTTTVSSSDTAVAFNTKAAAADDVDLAGLTAGSTVAINALATTTGAAAAAKVDTITVAYAVAEAATTIDVNTGFDDSGAAGGTLLDVTNVTALTIDFAELVGDGTAGDIDITDATSLTINAAKDIVFDEIIAAGEKLAALTVTASDKVTIDNVENDALLATVAITATDNVSLGTIADADAVTSVALTSTAGSVTLDTFAGTQAADNLTTFTVSAGTDVTIGDIDGDIIGDITVTATNGTLNIEEIDSAAGIGTISLTSTAGAIDAMTSGTDTVQAADTTGITVNMTAKTFITDDGLTGGNAIDITNTKGDITSTLAGAAKANVDYFAGTANTSASSGSVTLTASNTGGTTTIITNNEMVGNGVSTITLSALNSSTTNSVTLLGYSAVTNVTGSIGADTVVNSAGGNALTTDSTNSNDVYSLGSGTDTLSYAGNTHGAASGTASAGATTNGYAMNFTSSSITFDNTPVTGATNITTLAAGTVAQYDSTAVSSVSTTAGNIVAGGEMDTVSGVEVIIGSGLNDYIAVANTGMTVTGGDGDDKIVLNSGSDTVKFSATGATNDSDTITNFTVADGKDVLDLSAIDAIPGGTDQAFTIVNTTTASTKAITLVAAATTGVATSADVDLAGKVAFVSNNITTKADLIKLFGTSTNTSGTYFLATTTKGIIISDNGGTKGYVWLVENDTTTAAIATSDVTLLGTVTFDASGTTDGLVTSNFVL